MFTIGLAKPVSRVKMKEEINMKRILAILIAAMLALTLLSGAAFAESALTDGTYTSEQQGFGGPVVVEITVAGGAITEAKVTGDMETEGIGAAALEPLAEQIMAAQSADIDGVSGASLTSGAVKAALAEIFAEASGQGAGFIRSKARIGAIASSSFSIGAVPLSRKLPHSLVFRTLFPMWNT